MSAAEEALQFVCDKKNKVVGAESQDDVHGHIIKEVRGLLLPHDVQGYHTTKAQAINELNSGMMCLSFIYSFTYLIIWLLLCSCHSS